MEEDKQMKKTKLKTKKKFSGINVLATTTFWMVMLVAFSSVFTFYQLQVQEDGILDVCATQQDAYVQLVLDQINLKDNRNDEEIINDILSTLDSSTNKYWTFSKDKDMLFVKDVIETNRYKGLTAISYYDSESAKEFMEDLELNKVMHASIEVGEKEYVASGVSFKYADEDYRLCLLTNKDVILNNNKFMEARIELVILVGFMLVVVLVTSMLFARKQQQLKENIGEKLESINDLQKTIAQQNEMYGQKDHYDTRYQLWNKSLIKEFIEKLQKKNVNRAIVVRIHCMNEEDKKEFFDKASVVLDKKVLRFVINEKDILLMFIGTEQHFVQENMQLILNSGVIVDSMEEMLFDRVDLNEYVKNLDKEV